MSSARALRWSTFSKLAPARVLEEARNTGADLTVLGLVGERGREVLDFLENQSAGKQGRGGEARRGQQSVPALVEEKNEPQPLRRAA